MKRKKSAPKTESLADLIRRQQKALALGKRNYALCDRLTDELERQMEPAVGVALGPGQVAFLIDKMGNGRTQHFHGSYFRRYEIQIVNG